MPDKKKEKREELYAKFGPLLIEAIYDDLNERITAIEQQLNITAPKDKDEALGKVEQNLDKLKKPTWMKR